MSVSNRVVCGTNDYSVRVFVYIRPSSLILMRRRGHRQEVQLLSISRYRGNHRSIAGDCRSNRLRIRRIDDSQ